VGLISVLSGRKLAVSSSAVPEGSCGGNAAQALFDHAQQTPDRVAARVRVEGQWQPLSAAQVAAQVLEIARGLLGAGVGDGQRLAIMSRTTLDWSLLDFAALSIGAVVVPIYETSSASQVEWILADSGAIALVVETDTHAATAREVVAATSVRQIWQLSAGGMDEIRTIGGSTADEQVHAARDAVAAHNLATIIYTSGTTGRPKGVQITHGNLLAEVAFVREQMPGLFNPDNATLLFLPLAHVFGRAIGIAALSTGCVLGHVPDTKALLGDLDEFKPTFILAVPRVFEKVYNGAQQKAQAKGKLAAAIFARAEATAVAWSKAEGGAGVALKARHALYDKLVLAKLRAALGGRCTTAISGGAALGERLGHFFHGVGLTVLEGYGLTETTAAVAANRPGHVVIGTVGTVIPGAELKLSESGEVMVRGAVVFGGYWHNDDATAAAFDADGWFRTGDLGALDAQGNLRITGRSKEILVTAAGKNVAPAPLEDLIRGHWLVGQAMVVGEAKPFVGALITIDPEAWPLWLERAGADPATDIADMIADPALLGEVQRAIDAANRSVSRAESIRSFRILGIDWTEAGGQITPSLKLKRNVVREEHQADIEALYSASRDE
jgi:long-chain acyl-CoA synthetase